MKKVIYLLSILCLAAAVIFAIHNRRLLEQTDKNIAEVAERKIKVTRALTEKEEERDILKESKSETVDTKQQIVASVEDKKRTLAIVNRKIDGGLEERKELSVQQKEMDLAIKELFRGNALQTVEQLSASQQAYHDSLSSLRSQMGELNEEIAWLKVQNQSQTEVVGVEEEHQIERIKKISRGQLQGTVIAINHDWGFVMVNAGEAHGIETGTTFLVNRAKRRVARLAITHLREGVCLCRVQRDDNIEAVRIGDSVIIEDTTM